MSCGCCFGAAEGGDTSAGRRPAPGRGREVLGAITVVATSRCTWRRLPPAFGQAWPTVYRHFAHRSRDRV
ncbi:transposase [Streptomyces sp. ms191]|uniref:transposase n=1 Tax=Streptomyces sp. ms191 TaxID=1827978 RepID=UPI0013113BFC|nr:transposase [Streptomyces sp. ms191]